MLVKKRAELIPDMIWDRQPVRCIIGQVSAVRQGVRTSGRVCEQVAGSVNEWQALRTSRRVCERVAGCVNERQGVWMSGRVCEPVAGRVSGWQGVWAPC